MIPVRILGTASLLPGSKHATVDLAAEVLPHKDPAYVVERTGIETRYWSDPHTRLAEYAAQALGQAIEEAGLRPEELRRIVVANCTGAELAFPAVSNEICMRLGLRGSCDTFTLNNACCGFLSSFDVAARSVATGLAPVGVVAVELCSRHITPDDPRPYLVFADAIGAAVLGEGREGEGILASYLANDGSLPGNAVLANPTLTGKPEYIEFPQSNQEMTEVAISRLMAATRTVLDRAAIRLQDIEWVLPHQPNGSMLERIIEALELDRSKLVKIVDEIGSPGSPSIAISLDRLMHTRQVLPGDRILMVGVGSGVSYGSILYRVGV
jgi:3-oxoacyl-[acyl-carrier-protein] synthase III